MWVVSFYGRRLCLVVCVDGGFLVGALDVFPNGYFCCEGGTFSNFFVVESDDLGREWLYLVYWVGMTSLIVFLSHWVIGVILHISVSN